MIASRRVGRAHQLLIDARFIRGGHDNTDLLLSMISRATIKNAVKLLMDVLPSGSQVILFGSYANGSPGVDSDLDFLVVEPVVTRRREEMVRLRQVLRPLDIPVDILVVSRAVFDAWKDLPNNVINEAVRNGKVFTHAA